MGGIKFFIRSFLFVGVFGIVYSKAGARKTGFYVDGVSLRAVSDSSNVFMEKMYNALTEEENGNFVFSPFALSAQLGILKQGAFENTSKEIQLASLFANDDTTIYKGYSALFHLYKLIPATKSSRNQIFIGENFLPSQIFKRIVETQFDTQFKLVANLTQASTETIAAEIMTNKFKGLVSAVFMDTKLTMKMSSMFKAEWERKFDPNKTVIERFYTNDDQFVNVSMMRRTTEYEFANLPHLDARAISIPFQETQLNMIILLPNKRNGLAALETQLKEYSFHLIADKLLKSDLQNVSLSLPKFVIKSAHDLQDPLEEIGMKTLFSPLTANLSGIPLIRESLMKGFLPLHVSDFLQSAEIHCNELGTFGMSVTRNFVSDDNNHHPEEFGPDGRRLAEFTVNHPFIGYIHDWITNTVLYTFRKVE